MSRKRYVASKRHLKHQVSVHPTHSLPHKYKMTCDSCGGVFIKWATETEYQVFMSLQNDKESDAK
jgi:hypothetical protein